MKDLVRLPAVFLLAFLLLSVAILAVSLLAAWGGLLPALPGSPEARGQALAAALALLPRLAGQALPAGALAALLVVLLRIARRPGSRLLSLLLPPACAFLVLVLGYPVLEGLAPAAPAAASPPDYLEPQVFTATSSGALYVESLAGGRATGVVVLGEGSDRGGRLTHFPRAVLQVRADTAALRLGQSAVQWPARPVYEPLFAAEQPIRPFLRDVGLLSERLSRQHAQQRGTFYLSCLSWVVALCGVAVLLRLSSWPLLNACLTLLAARGLLALFVRLGSEGAAVFGRSLTGSAGGLPESLPAAGLLLLGAVLILVDLLFVPFDREREGSSRA